MRNRHRLIAAIIVMFTLLLITCSPTDQAGNSTQVGNPGSTVAGMLYLSDGRTPAAGVKVAIRLKNSLADTAGFALGKRMADTAMVVTDSAGRFAFDSTLDTGTYVVEATSGNDVVLIDSVVVTAKDSTDSLPPDTLKSAGAIKGVIRLSEGGDPRKVFVLAFGIDRFARVEADGKFRFSGLAEGKYDLRLISGLDDYGVLDTVNVPVKAGDTLDMDTIELPFTGIPTVKNVSIAYDTSKQIVTLTWGMADTALVKGFNVYRRNVDSNSMLKQVNTSPVIDTVFRDSTGVQDLTYEYRVAAVDKNATEGVKSAGVGVKVVGAFKLIKVIDVKRVSESPVKVIGTSISEPFYLLSRAPTPGVFVLDSSGALIDSFGIGIIEDPYDMIRDSMGNIYVSNIQKKQIIKFDTLGDSIGEWNTDNAGNVITIDDSVIFVGSSTNVKVFSLEGIFIREFSYQETELKGLIVGTDGNLFIYGDKTISKYTRYGVFLTSIYNTDLSNLPSYNANGYLINIAPDKLMFLLNNTLYVIGQNGELFLKQNEIGTPIRIYSSQKTNDIWLADISGKVNVYRR